MNVARKHLLQAIEAYYTEGRKTSILHFKKYSIRVSHAWHGFTVKIIRWRKVK